MGNYNNLEGKTRVARISNLHSAIFKKLNSKSVGNLANIVLTNFVLKRPYKLADQPKLERIKHYVGTKA